LWDIHCSLNYWPVIDNPRLLDRSAIGRAPGWKASLARTFEWGLFNSNLLPRNQMPYRSFPPPWSSEEHSGYYVIRDRNGLGLAYIYFQKEVGLQSAAKLLSKDEARRIAANFARLPELLPK
jgi:hypothetical protein